MKTYDKRYWKQLSKSLNDWVQKGRWKEDRVLKIEHTGFFGLHVGDRGPNHNESGLLNLSTRIIEAKAIHFAAGKQSYFSDVYIEATVHGREAGTYLELRKNGKTYQVALHDNTTGIPWQLKKCLGEINEFLPEEYARFVENKKEENNRIQVGEREELSDWFLKREFEKEYASEVCDLFQHYAQDEFKERLQKAGVKILVFFRFTHKLEGARLPHHSGCISTSFTRILRHGIEFGWISSGTYNALPNVVKIEKSKGLPTVKLSEIGVEGTGYYDHHFRCSIPRAQASGAKKLIAKFRGAK